MLLGFLPIYPKAVEWAKSSCETALEKFGIGTAKLDEKAEGIFKQAVDLEHITNSIIYAYYEATNIMIHQEDASAEIDYFINCEDSHFYVNGEEMD